MNIAIIPARGGSKRLPGKNIKLLHGKPLICWTIEAALKSKIFDKVIVSTDSQEIADIAEKAGAFVPGLRPREFSDDLATTDSVILYTVELLESLLNKKVNCITLLQPTSPLRNCTHIQDAYNLFLNKNATSVISVCKVEHPVQYCNKLPSDRSMNEFIPKNNLKRSQDLEPYFRINGAIYIFKRVFVGDLIGIYNENSFAYEMSSYESVDIDEAIDFDLAEFYFNKLK